MVTGRDLEPEAVAQNAFFQVFAQELFRKREVILQPGRVRQDIDGGGVPYVNVMDLVGLLAQKEDGGAKHLVRDFLVLFRT